MSAAEKMSTAQGTSWDETGRKSSYAGLWELDYGNRNNPNQTKTAENLN